MQTATRIYAIDGDASLDVPARLVVETTDGATHEFELNANASIDISGVPNITDEDAGDALVYDVR